MRSIFPLFTGRRAEVHKKTKNQAADIRRNANKNNTERIQLTSEMKIMSRSRSGAARRGAVRRTSFQNGNFLESSCESVVHMCHTLITRANIDRWRILISIRDLQLPFDIVFIYLFIYFYFYFCPNARIWKIEHVARSVFAPRCEIRLSGNRRKEMKEKNKCKHHPPAIADT